MKFLFLALTFSATVVVQPLVDDDVLEPSICNEVEHAIEKGERATTNRVSRTDIAIRLVSAQKADGRWLVGTNDVTAVVIGILKALQ